VHDPSLQRVVLGLVDLPTANASAFLNHSAVVQPAFRRGLASCLGIQLSDVRLSHLNAAAFPAIKPGLELGFEIIGLSPTVTLTKIQQIVGACLAYSVTALLQGTGLRIKSALTTYLPEEVYRPVPSTSNLPTSTGHQHAGDKAQQPEVPADERESSAAMVPLVLGIGLFAGCGLLGFLFLFGHLCRRSKSRSGKSRKRKKKAAALESAFDDIKECETDPPSLHVGTTSSAAEPSAHLGPLRATCLQDDRPLNAYGSPMRAAGAVHERRRCVVEDTPWLRVGTTSAAAEPSAHLGPLRATCLQDDRPLNAYGFPMRAAGAVHEQGMRVEEAAVQAQHFPKSPVLLARPENFPLQDQQAHDSLIERLAAKYGLSKEGLETARRESVSMQPPAAQSDVPSHAMSGQNDHALSTLPADMEKLHDWVRGVYARYNPSKLDRVDELLEQYESRESDLVRHIILKYRLGPGNSECCSDNATVLPSDFGCCPGA